MKERIVLYPYDINSSPILRHRNLLKKYEISGLVSPIGWSLCGKDASVADYGSPIGINVETDFNDLIEKCDTLLICDSDIKLDYEKFIKPKILQAIKSHKNIVCCITLDSLERKIICTACKDKKVYFTDFVQDGLYQNYTGEIIPRRLSNINTPVIFILGTSTRTHKFEIQLGLRDIFLNQGFKVSQVGTRNYCELFEFHSFPSFMFSSFISESKKVFIFNQFIKDIENNENPDVIIIGIPGGIMPINNNLVNEFGILAYEISQAILPDVSILSLLYEDYTPLFFDKISTSIKYKLGFELDCFNISNVQLDFNKSNDLCKLDFITFDSRFIDEV